MPIIISQREMLRIVVAFIKYEHLSIVHILFPVHNYYHRYKQANHAVFLIYTVAVYTNNTHKSEHALQFPRTNAKSNLER